MKIVALGANLPSRFGTPAQTLYEALKVLAEHDVWPVQFSRVWKTAPVPFHPDHPWYFNAVTEVRTDQSPEELLATLLKIEAAFGRIRTERNAPRILDLDLIAYDDLVLDGEDLILPHPRMQERAFVLMPLSDIAEDWVHPVSGRSLEDLLKDIPAEQAAEPVEGGWDE